MQQPYAVTEKAAAQLTCLAVLPFIAAADPCRNYVAVTEGQNISRINITNSVTEACKNFGIGLIKGEGSYACRTVSYLHTGLIFLL